MYIKVSPNQDRKYNSQTISNPPPLISIFSIHLFRSVFAVMYEDGTPGSTSLTLEDEYV